MPKEDFLKQLQSDYIATFQEKMTAIKGAFTARQWVTLAQIFHKLAGSGATYSMPEITEISREIETYLQSCQTPSMAFLEESISTLDKIFKCREKGESFDLSHVDFIKGRR